MKRFFVCIVLSVLCLSFVSSSSFAYAVDIIEESTIQNDLGETTDYFDSIEDIEDESSVVTNEETSEITSTEIYSSVEEDTAPSFKGNVYTGNSSVDKKETVASLTTEQEPVTLAVKDEYDINGDGEVTHKDAELVLRIAAGQADYDSVADVNKDGTVTIEDANLILVKLNTPDTDTAYVNHLLDMGFTKSYTEDLLALHKKYPKWEFIPFITNLDWNASVTGEHTPHKKQLIETVVSADLKCSCSACDGVIQESSNWVSASEKAVEYYLDPRNFLNEEDIFQFETTAYNSSHTISAVESILKPTWMYKSYITYLNAEGKKKTFKQNGEPMKYSEAIMKAAEDSGMSAYYLASKIVQEVGSSSASYAGGSCGDSAPYNGIYNYYNIGAYTGATDGLRWANGYMKTTAQCKMYKTASTSGTVITSVSSGIELNYISKSGNFYKVKAKVDGKYYSGYIHKNKISISTKYGRPWNNPYKTIYYGAQYIYSSFSELQFTGYLQKFNVNPASDSLYSHEYMANIRGAVSESKKSYNAYKENGILSDSMIFYIPVFKNMPNADYTKKDAFKNTKPQLSYSATRTSVTIKWDAVEGAKKYQVYKYDSATEKYKRVKITAGTSYKLSDMDTGSSAKFKIRGYYTDGDETVFTKYSSVITAKTLSGKVKKVGTINVSDELNIREKPSSASDAKILTTLTNGKQVNILGKSGSWYKVSFKKDGTTYTGYAYSDYITTKLVFGGKSYSEPSSTLSKGDEGNDVIWIQMHLVYLGYLTNDDVTGKFDDKTTTAAKQFQKDKGLEVDGYVGPATRSALKKAVK